ncbi:MAG: hypothetical protein HPY54_07475 [Chthonomonadetes bacterium]|nr:hypothetical protein [Chthonomonadetes bacterium]
MKREAIALLLGYFQNQMQVIDNILQSLQATQPDNQERVVVTGYYLHNLYSAAEDLFEEVASAFENQLEPRGSYHRELLQRMSIDVPTIRPRLVSPDSLKLLDDLRGFRHVFRHSYTYTLDPQRVAQLRQTVLDRWNVVQEDLTRFQQFLESQLG